MIKMTEKKLVQLTFKSLGLGRRFYVFEIVSYAHKHCIIKKNSNVVKYYYNWKLLFILLY